MIKLVTFKTNQTIMGDLDEVMNGVYSIKQPVQVVMQPTKEGPAIAFLPFLEFAQEFKTGIQIPKQDVLVVNTPVIELENQYNQIFGSGIQIASANELLK
jgi:hypothetical protein